MSSVHCVFAVDVPVAKEGVVAFFHEGDLVHRRVGPQALSRVLIEGVCRLSRNMVLGYEQIVEAVFYVNEGIEFRKHLKFLSFYFDVRNRAVLIEEKFLDLIYQYSKGVVGNFVDFALREIPYTLWNVVE